MDIHEIEAYFDNLLNIIEVSEDEVANKPIVDVLKAKVLPNYSKTQIRQLVTGGAVVINNETFNDSLQKFPENPLAGKFFVVKISKKKFYALKISDKNEQQIRK